MAEYTNSNGASRPPGRGGRGRRRPGGNNPNRSGNSNYDDRERSPRREPKTPPPSGFQKFLHAVSFGLLGKSGAQKPYASTTGNIQPQRTPRVERTEREDRPERAERGPRPERSERPREPRPPRQHPTSAEVTGEKLYVGNLSYDASESDLFELFQGAGRVKNAEVVVNSRTQRSKGFAFVTMMSIDEAKKAVNELNGKDFMSRPLVVGGAKPMTPRDERSDDHSESESSDQAEETASA